MKLVELAYFTDDVPAMTAFYRTLFGVEPVNASDRIAIFDVDGTTILIHAMVTPGDDELPPRDHVAYAIDDVDKTCRDLAQRGLAIDVAPRDYDWGRAAYLSDPAGHLVELIQTSQ